MLHYQVKLWLCFYDLIQLYNVRMADNLKYMYLSCDSLHIIDIFDFCLLKDLDSDL